MKPTAVALLRVSATKAIVAAKTIHDEMRIDRWVQIVDALWNHTATEVSEFSHGIAWQVAQNKASIPYEAVFLSNEALTETTTACERRSWRLNADGNVRRMAPDPFSP